MKLSAAFANSGARFQIMGTRCFFYEFLIFLYYTGAMQRDRPCMAMSMAQHKLR
jgi:hypothetical protein